MANGGQVAVVTGANRGLGLEVARQLGRAGAMVVLTSRDEESGREACRELAGKGLEVSWLALDVRDDGSVARLGESLAAEHGGIDILVNNAGVALDGFGPEIVATTIDTNFFGPLRVTDSLLPLVRARGRIVMVSSGLGSRSCLTGEELRRRFASPLSRSELVELMNEFVAEVAAGTHSHRGWPSSGYNVSKVGLNKLTEIYAAELAGDERGILCNAGCPGWVRTRMGGAHAPRSVEEGARTLTWLALLPADGPTGGFFRDEQPADW